MFTVNCYCISTRLLNEWEAFKNWAGVLLISDLDDKQIIADSNVYK